MEKLLNYDIIIDIEMITNISGGNRIFEIEFFTADHLHFKMVFEDVWDMRYAIENGCIDRFVEFRKTLDADIIDNGTYIVENSEYIKCFERQASGTLPTKLLTDFIVCDSTDTVIEVLSTTFPKLIKLDRTPASTTNPSSTIS